MGNCEVQEGGKLEGLGLEDSQCFVEFALGIGVRSMSSSVASG